VSAEVVIDNSLSYMLLLMVPEQVRDCYCCSYARDCSFLFFCFFSDSCFLLVVLSFLPILFVSSFWEVFL
jgi:hypothetical protein